MEQTALANVKPTKEKKIYTGVPARAMKLLAQGVTPEETAKALGVDASLIAQYRAEDEFKEQLHALVQQEFTDANEIDTNYLQIEKRLSKRLVEQTEFMMNPDQILRTLKFANDAKRKIAPNLQNGGNSGSAPGQIRAAILILPTVIRKEFVLNPNNEIVAVDEKELVTLNSKSLDSLVEKTKVPKLTHANTNRQSSDPYSDL